MFNLIQRVEAVVKDQIHAESGESVDAEPGKPVEVASSKLLDVESGRSVGAESGRSVDAEPGRSVDAGSGRSAELPPRSLFTLLRRRPSRVEVSPTVRRPSRGTFFAEVDILLVARLSHTFPSSAGFSIRTPLSIGHKNAGYACAACGIRVLCL